MWKIGSKWEDNISWVLEGMACGRVKRS